MTKITLSQPLKIDGKEISEIDIRKPKAGELRGINLLDLLQMKTEVVVTVLSRVSTPHLTEQQGFELDIADVVKAGAALVGFFNQEAATLPK